MPRLLRGAYGRVFQTMASNYRRLSFAGVSACLTFAAFPCLAAAEPTEPQDTRAAATVTNTSPDLSDPIEKEIAMQIVCSAENSSLKWRSHYAYIQDINDGRGYTGGIIGFCSGTGDMRHVIQEYTRHAPGNRLAKYLPALRKLNGSDAHDGLDPGICRRLEGIGNRPSVSSGPEQRTRQRVLRAVGTAGKSGRGCMRSGSSCTTTPP